MSYFSTGKQKFQPSTGMKQMSIYKLNFMNEYIFDI